jgi:DNA-binding transcriptional regulator YhcF (GntR family)
VENGWIKLHRKLLENPLAKKPNYLAVWVFVLMNANHEDKEVIWNKENRIIKRGSFIGSLRKIAEQFSISIATVKYIIDYLVSEHMIEHLPTRKFSMFTVLNWDKYQLIEHQPVNKVKSKLNQSETTNNYNNDKKDKNTHTPSVSFELFWNLYPKKVERKKAEEKWDRLSEDVQGRILEDIPKRQLGRQWQAGYIPNPTTYLNGERWTDQIEMSPISTGSLILN